MPRANNGSVENRRLTWLVTKFNEMLETKDPAFISMLTSAGIGADSVEKFIVAGGAAKHYDMTILFKDGTTKNIEHSVANISTMPPNPTTLKICA